MIETKAEIIFDKACSNIVPNEVIEKVLYEAFREEEPVIHNEEELQYAKNF
ncbi:hypothetical protein [Peptoniphilus raoultii]|uniref:hypothetical protein n=1 Tax=Peptoniphilus raoultii TaxID=1776387 RepID=UPI001FD64CC7|nr:hypothetical protein [Peptoniphilus raoultii]